MTEILYSYVLLGVGEHYPLASAHTYGEFFIHEGTSREFIHEGHIHYTYMSNAVKVLDHCV